MTGSGTELTREGTRHKAEVRGITISYHEAGPGFTAHWDAHVRAHTSAGMALVAKGVISAFPKHSLRTTR